MSFYKERSLFYEKDSISFFLRSSFGQWGAMAASTYQLDPVVVTANRVEQKAFDAQADVAVVTAKEIKTRQYTNLGDVLKDIPGMTVQHYGSTGENYSSNRMYTHGVGAIVIMVDGMRINREGDVSAAYEFPHMDTIERVEVLKGPGSTLYGADAAGGVINVITKKGTHSVHSSLEVISGSFGKREMTFNSRGALGDFFYRLSAGNSKIGNYTDAYSHYVRQETSVKKYDVTLGHKFDKDSFVSLNYNRYMSDYIRPSNGGYIGTTYPKDIYDWKDKTKINHHKGDLVSKDKHGIKDNERFSLNWNQKLDDHFKNQLVIFQNKRFFNDGGWGKDYTTSGVTEQLTYRGNNHIVVAGIDYSKDSGDKAAKWSKDIKVTNKAFFLQDEFTFAPDWTITPGVRYTNNSKGGSKTTKDLVFGYNNGTANAYVSYREFFVLPQQFQWFSPDYGNPNLQPTTGYGLEAGVRYRMQDDLLLSATVFRTKLENLIVYKPTPKPDNAYAGTYENKSQETADGATLGIEKVLNDKFRAKVYYTYTHIPALSGQNENRDGYIPKGQVNVDLDYTNGKFQSVFIARGIFNRPGRKVNENKVPDSMKTFWVADLAVTYTPSDSVSAFFKVNNIFDKFYTDMLYNANPNVEENMENWYPAPGRNFQFGMEFKF